MKWNCLGLVLPFPWRTPRPQQTGLIWSSLNLICSPTLHTRPAQMQAQSPSQVLKPSPGARSCGQFLCASPSDNPPAFLTEPQPPKSTWDSSQISGFAPDTDRLSVALEDERESGSWQGGHPPSTVPCPLLSPKPGPKEH